MVGLFCGCTGTGASSDGPGAPPDVPEVVLNEVPDLGWATRIVQEPTSFSALMQRDGRERWVRWHAHDWSWDAATAEAHGDWQRRLALLELRADLQHLSTAATERLVTSWQARGTLGDDLGARTVLAMAKVCEAKASSAAASTGEEAVDTELADQVGPLVEGLPPDEAQAVREGARFQQRRWEKAEGGFLEARIRKKKDAGLWMFGDRELERADFVGNLVEVDADGNEVRVWQDPCIPWHGMYSLYKTDHPRAQLAAADPQDLGTSLFSERFVDISQLGLSTTPPTTDDPQAAREEVRVLDATLDATRALLEKEADPDGLALLQQIRPLRRLRQEVLVDRARSDLRAGRVQRAYATLLLARDVTEREIGPANGPALFALLAEANLRAGRSREALDALQPLVARFPETAATREIISDLVVLEGMDRTGDSKEQ